MKIKYIAKTTFEYKKKTYIQGQAVEGVTPESEEYLNKFDVLEIIGVKEIRSRGKKSKDIEIEPTTSETEEDEQIESSIDNSN
jgi:hypothetical protein